MRRCVIIGGAPIQDYQWIRQHLLPDDFYIFCDGGLKHRQSLQVTPDLLVGDFDSWDNPKTETETIVLPRKKDDTDTFFGVKEGVKRGFEDFLLIGVIGGRFDHSLGNISALLYLTGLGKKALIIDDYSSIEVVSSQPVFIEQNIQYFSVLNIDGKAKGITIKNAQYPLENAEITWDYQYGISNQVLPGKTAEVTTQEGRLLLVKVYRE